MSNQAIITADNKPNRKIKLLEHNWLIFEENEKLWAAHFCSGNTKRKPWFNQAINLKTNSSENTTCNACGNEIPNSLLMILKISNLSI